MARKKAKRENRESEIRAVRRFTRISAFKARKIADIVRGKRVEDALAVLQFMPQKATVILEKLIRSAMANAEQVDANVIPEELWIKKITVDEGPTLHRIQFRAQGRVYRIRKRTSHIKVVLSDNFEEAKRSIGAHKGSKKGY